MVNIIKQRRPLSERPAEAGARDVAGHWEADFMLFAQYGQCILVAHERAYRFTFIERPQDRKADRTDRHLAALLPPMPRRLRRTRAVHNEPTSAPLQQQPDTGKP